MPRPTRTAIAVLVLITIFSLVCATAISGQYQHLPPITHGILAPVVDGSVGDGEYLHNSGDWYMMWDSTYLYVAKKNVNTGVLVVQLDLDPQSTPTNGGNSTGNLTTYPDTMSFRLPFRGDARIYTASTGSNHVSRDGAGGWGSPVSMASSDVAIAANTHEFRVAWTSLAALTQIPASFNWLGYELTGPSVLTTTQAMPAANSGSMSSIPYFYAISSSGAFISSFAHQFSTWSVVSTADSGTDTLRDAITNANGDATSIRRYIPFHMSSGSQITTASNLPDITRTTTIDGTTHSSFASTPVVILRGFSTSSSRGVAINGPSNCAVKGLVLQNHNIGIRIDGGSGHSIVGNFIGTDVSGTAASSNFHGVQLSSCSACVIGASGIAGRNVISGNLFHAIRLISSTGTIIQNNYLGTNKDGTAALGNASAIDNFSSTGATIGGTTSDLRNVISGNSGAMTVGSGDVVYGNYIGVGADGVTAIANQSGISGVGASGVTIGSHRQTPRLCIRHLLRGAGGVPRECGLRKR
jgi:hypothetical protein